MYILGYIYDSAHRVLRTSKAPAQRPAPFAGTRRALAALRNWRARRAAILEIEALPDRLLCDIGMNRGDIDAAVTALMGGKDAQAATGLTAAGVAAGPFKAACS